MYYPRLHLRDNGMRALGNVPMELQPLLSPFIQVVRTKSLKLSPRTPHETDELVQKIVNLIRLGVDGRTIFGDGQPFYLGMGQLQSNVRTSLRKHPLEAVGAQLWQTGHKMIPVVRIGSSDPYLMAAKQMAEIYSLGCCIRITKNDLLDERLYEKLHRLTYILGLGRELGNIDLLIDYGHIRWRVTNIVEQILRIPRLSDWRTVIFGAGSMPPSMSVFKEPGEYFRPSYEQETFDHIQKSLDLIGRPIGYCDYCTRHPVYQFSNEGHPPSPSVKYSVPDGWVFYKGRIARNGKGKTRAQQMLEHAFRLKGSPFFGSLGPSDGDRFVEGVVSGTKKPAHMNGWLQAEIIRHICLKTRMLKHTAASKEGTA